MIDVRRFVALSPGPLAGAARAVYRGLDDFSLPAPAMLARPAAAALSAARTAYHFGARVLLCEPFFKGRCARYGRNLHTGSFLHWIQGSGDIIVSDDVRVDGKSSITFAASLSERPTLHIGDRTTIAHRCSFVVAREISIGADCLIAQGVWFFDSPGHPSDPDARRARQRPAPEDVKPVIIEDNVWIGRDAVITPGVRVGEGSIVAAKALVISDVPPNTVVMGNPARRVLQLKPAGGAAAGDPAGGAGHDERGAPDAGGGLTRGGRSARHPIGVRRSASV